MSDVSMLNMYGYGLHILESNGVTSRTRWCLICYVKSGDFVTKLVRNQTDAYPSSFAPTIFRDHCIIKPSTKVSQISDSFC